MPTEQKPTLKTLQTTLLHRKLMLSVQLEAAKETKSSFRHATDLAYLPYVSKIEGRIDEVDKIIYLLSKGKKPTAYA